jgi:hypothetical protein
MDANGNNNKQSTKRKLLTSKRELKPNQKLLNEEKQKE